MLKKIFKIFLPFFVCFCLSIQTFASMNGIDVSSWQTGIDVSSTGAEFVVIKATEGVGYVNPDCDRVYQEAVSDGMPRGVYHYAAGGKPEDEAQYFLDNIKGYIGDSILILDYESYASYNGPGWAKRWLDYVYNHTGVKPLIYMNLSTLNSYNWESVRNADYGLWIAAYHNGYTPYYSFDENSIVQGNIYPWDDCLAMFQYTSSGYLNGWNGELDLNVFYGDRETWNAYVGENVDYDGGTTTDAGNIIYYTVQYGDTLSGIATMYGTTYTELANINGIANPNLIYPGQVLAINGENQISYYIVQYGDTLSGIAYKYGTTYTELAQKNGISNPNLIYPGQVIYL